MIVILSYYSDGSGKLELHFFPEHLETQINALAVRIADAGVASKRIEIYRIDDVNNDAVRIYPAD